MANGAEAEVALLSKLQELQMEIEAFAVYNENREAFSALMARASSFVGILSGTALVAFARSENFYFSLFFGFLTSALSSASLVFDFSGLAQRHRELRQKLVMLLDEIPEEDSPDEREKLAKIRKDYQKTYADSPLIFYAASANAYNSIQRRHNRKEFLKISWWQHLIRNFWRFSPDTFQNKRC